jgi:ribosomal protein S13
MNSIKGIGKAKAQQITALLQLAKVIAVQKLDGVTIRTMYTHYYRQS